MLLTPKNKVHIYRNDEHFINTKDMKKSESCKNIQRKHKTM